MKKSDIKKKEKGLKEYYDSLPDWYWKHGLHDAEIIDIKEYNRPDKLLRASDYNYLQIRLNCSNALYENDITALHFYNYRVISGNYNSLMKEAVGSWWFSDEPTVLDDGTIKIMLVLKDKNNNDLKYIIQCDRVKIIRR